MSCRSIPITENAFPDEEGDEIIVFPCGNGWGACFREDEYNGPGYGFDPHDPLLAAADLVLDPWKG